MNKCIVTLMILCCAYFVHAQIPQSMNYQAVARNNAGVALANQTIQVRLTIKRGNVDLYSETRGVTTNLLGLFNVRIGSPGATSTSGSFPDINWYNNTPEIILLRVELDLNNNNVFTDMGSQPFNSVPHAFLAKNSIEVLNLAGRYIDQATVPTVGARLSWNGSAWTPVKKDTTIYISSIVNSIPAGGPSAPWAWAGQQYTFVSTGTENISASFAVSLGHSSGNYVPAEADVCYQSLPSGNILSFYDNGVSGIDFAIPVFTTAPRTLVSAVGKKILPAGSYKIGMCVRNKSGTGVSLNNNDFVRGVIEIKN